MSKAISAVLSGLIGLACTLSALCQTCPSLTTSLIPYSGASGWQYGASVTVYIVSNSDDGTFSPDAQNAFRVALSNWNNQVGSAMSLTFNVVDPVHRHTHTSRFSMGMQARVEGHQICAL